MKYVRVYVDPNSMIEDGSPYAELEFLTEDEDMEQMEKSCPDAVIRGFDEVDTAVKVSVYVEVMFPGEFYGSRKER